MSMILDALQRADRERRQQEPAVPSLNDTPAPPPKPRRRLWWAVGGLALVAALGLAAFLLPRPATAPAPRDTMPQSQTEAPPAEPTEAVRYAPQQERASTENSATQPAETPDIAQLYQSPTEDNASVAELYRDTNATPETASESARDPEPQSQPAQTATASDTDDTNTDANAEAAEPPEPEEPAMASIRDLPWNLQQSLPSLNYQSHAYREGDASQVVINGKTLRGGDRIAPELVLERIDRDGVVLRYQGYAFKLKALSSWVNM